MIKAAIFDLDGTLTDTMGFWDNVYNEYLATLNLKARPETREAVYQSTIGEAADYIKDMYSLPFSQGEVIDGINNIMLKHYINDAETKPHLTEALNLLKERDIPMCIASATDREPIIAALNHTNIRKYFYSIFTTTEIGVGKHSPNIFLEAAKCMGAKPEETLVFEDAIHAIKTAKKASFITVGIKDKYCQVDEQTMRNTCDFYLTDWSEFKTSGII